MRLTANNYAYNTIKDEYEKTGKRLEKGYHDKVIKYINSFWEPTPLMTIKYEEVDNKGAFKENQKSGYTSTDSNVCWNNSCIYNVLYIIWKQLAY